MAAGDPTSTVLTTASAATLRIDILITLAIEDGSGQTRIA